MMRPRRGIESLDDRDMFRYKISEAGDVPPVTGRPARGVGFWYVWDSNGNLWLEAAVAPVATIERHHEPGTYYAEVGTPFESEGNTGTYTFSVSAISD